jgi:hypothetical protein
VINDAAHWCKRITTDITELHPELCSFASALGVSFLSVALHEIPDELSI